MTELPRDNDFVNPNCPHIDAINAGDWSVARLSEGFCPECSIGLEPRDEFGYCGCCHSQWNVVNNRATRRWVTS